MRIVRPGSVVGPQQQYLYLKQLEWIKWAAVDEVKRTQDATVAKLRTTTATPVTPPGDSEDENMVTDLTALTTTTTASTTSVPVPRTPPPVLVPPVTPSRHVAAAASKAKAMSPPGQPRKTPAAKRPSIAVEDSDEDEADDVLPALNIAPPVRRTTKTKPASARVAGSRGITASEQRPTRVTRSTVAAASRRVPTVSTTTTTTTTTRTTRANGQAPNKIPRLANTTTARSTAAAVTNATTTRRLRCPPSPIPSRLPTFAHTRRAAHQSAASVQESPATIAAVVKAAQSSDWMSNNAAASVVKPGNKSERPNLRPIRRRRSSFSAADVVA